MLKCSFCCAENTLYPCYSPVMDGFEGQHTNVLIPATLIELTSCLVKNRPIDLVHTWPYVWMSLLTGSMAKLIFGEGGIRWKY